MTSSPTACVLLIGNELLSGKTPDQNLPYIAEKLSSVGVIVRECRIIPDIEATIIETVNACRTQFDYVFTTGGIGPTHDDITSATIAKALQLPLIRHPEAEAALRNYYGEAKTNEARLSMADMPEGSALIPNPISIAPGFQIHNIYVLAGVPSICRAMMDHVALTIKGGAPMRAISFDVECQEGDIADELTRLQASYPQTEIGIYPRYGEGRLYSHVVIRSIDGDAIEHAYQRFEAYLRDTHQVAPQLVDQGRHEA